jgi:signal transduction histidine kinase
MEKLSNLKCIFNHTLHENKIDDRISLILYRVLQESLTNVVRHSGASRVNVKLTVNTKKAKLTIEDNGKGIDENTIDLVTSMGITGIRESVASVSGTLIIHGEKNRGTRITIQIPLKM